MIVSCSPWIVATMSRIWPVRARLSSARRGSGGGLAAHPLEAVLRVPQARALERDVRVGHFAHVSQAEFARAQDFGVTTRRATPVSCEIPAHFVRLIPVTNPPSTRSARSV